MPKSFLIAARDKYDGKTKLYRTYAPSPSQALRKFKLHYSNSQVIQITRSKVV
jgi:hypothetical protein